MMLVLIAFCIGAVGCNSLANLRIAGGSSTSIEQHPYQAAIDKFGVQACGGAIIHSRWILTSASCFNNVISLPDTRVRLGAQLRDERVGESFAVHEYVMQYYVALLRLEADIVTGVTTRIIPLVPAGRPPAQGEVLLVSGYGDLHVTPRAVNEQDQDGQQRSLRVVGVAAFSSAMCLEAYGPDFVVTGPVVCATGGLSGRGICDPKDYGDPLVNWKGQLVGVAHINSGCGSGLPTVFMDLSGPQVQQFITDTIAES